MINGELTVDNFAGGGGASTGFELATGRSVDIAINHDPKAIAMHKVNHPETRHYCESVWDVDPAQICGGHPVALAWFSPDCKHFSKAKGGKPMDKNIRGLAWVALRWAAKVRPRVIILENVEEFMDWGPLSRRKHPIRNKKGQTFRKFLSQLQGLGYETDYRILTAADYGTPTMRKRFFLVARSDGAPIFWPAKEYGPGTGKPYVGACTQIDFSLPCPSIFATKEEIWQQYGIRAVRPLAEKTMRRIAKGLKKFVLDNPEPFLISEPNGEEEGKRKASYLIQYHSESSEDQEGRGQGLNRPILTVDASNRYGLVAAFLHKYYDGGYKGAGAAVKEPLPTVTVWDHNSLTAIHLVQMNNHCDGKDIRKPIPTITAGDGHFGEVRAFLIKYYSEAVGQEPGRPLDTIPTHDRFGLVVIQGEAYRIADIGLRMLEPKELYGCQGFPDDYIIDRDAEGNRYPRSEQVKRCGNAVCPPIAEALIRSNLPELCRAKRQPICRPDRLSQEQDGQLKFA